MATRSSIMAPWSGPALQRWQGTIPQSVGKRETSLLALTLAGAFYALVGDLPNGWLPSGPGEGPGVTNEDLRGAVMHVRDGDTIEVSSTPVRLANIDCAERDDADGSRATARMKELVAGQEVVCDLARRMSYDQEVGTCALASSGEDLGKILIREGVCAGWQW